MTRTARNDDLREPGVWPDVSAGYAPIPGVYDEMMEPGGEVRPHWRDFLNGLAAIPPEEIREGWARAQRIINENGITYNVYQDTGHGTHPWRMDTVPALIGAEEWRHIEAGLIQRARLLNAVVADL